MTDSVPKFDCIIIGGGVLGAFHAYHALNMGWRIAVLEKDSRPRGATTQNFGQVVPSGLSTQWQKFGRESLQIYRTIDQQCPISVRQNGSTYIASDSEELALIEELHEINRQHEYTSELWTAQQCRRRYPNLRSDYCQGGLFFPEEISVNPALMIHKLWNHLIDDPQLELGFRSYVNRIETSDNGNSVTVTTADGKRRCATLVIVCSGSDFQLLYPELFRESDLELVRLQMMRLKPQPDIQIPGNVLTGLSIRRYESFAQCPSWHEIKSREAADSFANRWGIHILFKQETDGGIILGDSHEYVSAAEDDAFFHELRSDINEYFLTEAEKIFELPAWDVESTWAGQYCQTKDPSGIFKTIIDDRIHIVTGIGGKGMTSSAGFAKHHLQQIASETEVAR